MNPTNQEVSKALANTLYQKCNEGHSLNSSFDPPQWGYMVAIKAGPCFPNPVSVEPTRVTAFIEKNMSLIHHPLFFFGVWKDKETGEVCFDLCEQCANLEYATKLGNKHKQIAIWDVSNEEEIRL